MPVRVTIASNFGMFFPMPAGPLSKELYNSAKQLMPGGVNSPVRSFAAVGGDPLFFEKGQGSKLTDADGREYIDYVMSWGPLIFGHAHKDILQKIHKTLDKGTSFGACSGFEVELAKLVVDRVPSVERIRFVNSGTEATMSVIRLARAYTDRTKIIKFDGCYHGHGDMLLVESGSGVATLGIPGSPGVPKSTVENTISVPYNDLNAVEAAIAHDPKAFAAIIVEPIAGNMGLVPPQAGYLKGLRDICDAHGILLIFDEVMTGFRVHPGGAQELYRVRPDLSCFGKIIGGGLPVGAYGGKAEIMKRVAPEGQVYQAGTLSGNPVCMVAGIKTLKMLAEPEVYENLEYRSQYLCEQFLKKAQDLGVPLCINRVGSMFTLFFTDQKEVTSFAQAKECNTRQYARYFNGMLDEGVYLPPSAFESWFFSLAHTESDMERTIKAHEKVLKSF